MDERSQWAADRETQKYLQDIHNRKQEIKEDLASGILLIHETAEKIAREYALNVGVILGLEELEKYINSKEEEESNDRSESLSGTDGN